MRESIRTRRIGQDEWTLLQLLYAILMGALLLDYLVIQAYDHGSLPLSALLTVGRLSVSLLGFFLGKLWKDKGFLFIGCFIVILAVRVIVKNNNLFFSDIVIDTLFTGIWAITGCYSIGKVLTTKQLKTFFRIIISAWTLGTVIQCVIALYSAWTDTLVYNLSGGAIYGVWFNRLLVGYTYPNTAGSTLSVSALIAICGLLIEKTKAYKCLYVISELIILITLSLTGARTSYLSFAVGLGVAAFILVYSYQKRKQETSTVQKDKAKKQAVVWISSVVCMFIVIIVSTIFVLKISPVFIALKTKGGFLISAAKAEEVLNDNQYLISRELDGTNLLSGRDIIWGKVLQYVLEEPKRLLFGVSIYNPMVDINRGAIEPMGHCHSMFFQILLESGLIGLLPIACFGIYIAKRAFRLIFRNKEPLWIRVFPAIMVSVLVGDLVECFGWFRLWKVPALPFLFIAAGIISVYGAEKNRDRSRSEMMSLKGYTSTSGIRG